MWRTFPTIQINKCLERVAPAMVTMICPHCDQSIGNEKNPFQFEIVNFSFNERVKGKKNPVQRVKSICAIYCDNCKRILGLTP